jgi:hypothetical protein
VSRGGEHREENEKHDLGVEVIDDMLAIVEKADARAKNP